MENKENSSRKTKEFCAIFHYDEIALKGKNRGFFEGVLVKNIQTKQNIYQLEGRIKIIFGRGIIYFSQKQTDKEIESWTSIFNTTFGIANFAFGLQIIHDKKISNLAANLDDFLFDKDGTFRVTTTRADKSFPSTSGEINMEIGGSILQKFPDKKVKLKNPEETFFIEILGGTAFLYLNKNTGPGGLPITSSGTGSVMLSGGIDSPVAAFYSMKRGIKPLLIHFHSYPQTAQNSLEKVRALGQKLTKFHPKLELFMVPFLDIQKIILKNAPDKFRILLYRRFMIRIAEKISLRNKSKVLITGESVGQVASQTLENIAAVERVTNMPILRPLCGFDKKEIITVARKIDTFNISIRAGDDCCTVFMPQSPETKAKIPEIEAVEEQFDIEEMVDEALEKMVVEHILFDKK